MLQISDIMWHLSFSDSSSSEIISWLWMENLHTHPFSLSCSLSSPKTTHVHKSNVCTDDGGVFLGGGFVLTEKVDSLAYYILKWVQNMSSKDFQAPEFLSDGHISNQLQTGTKQPSCFRTSKADIHPAVIHRQERTLVRVWFHTILLGVGSLTLVMHPK